MTIGEAFEIYNNDPLVTCPLSGKDFQIDTHTIVEDKGMIYATAIDSNEVVFLYCPGKPGVEPLTAEICPQ